MINIKEFLISHKSLNLTNEFETHKDKINKILEDVEKFKNEKLKITWRELNKSIIFDRYKINSGKAVAIEPDNTFIYQIKRSKKNFFINVKGLMINYMHFYQEFKEKGLVIGKSKILKAIKTHQRIKEENMDEYRKRNGIQTFWKKNNKF